MRTEQVIVHSDQCSQFGSDDFKPFCHDHDLQPSMSRRGNCRGQYRRRITFFSSVKKERVGKRTYKSREMARADVFDYIEVFYNRSRRHSHLGGSPEEAFEHAAA